MTIIDLSHPYKMGMGQFPGTPPIDFRQIAQIEEGGFRVTDFHSIVHVGTHCDAFAHVIEGAKTMDQIPLAAFIGEAVIVDAPVQDDLEIKADVLDGCDIRPGDIVLIRTGYSLHWEEQEYIYQAPYFSQELATRLVGLKVKAVGMDTISPDQVESTTSPIHKILMGNEIPIIENLNNLDKIKTDRVFFAAAPVLIDGADGGFARAFALLKE